MTKKRVEVSSFQTFALVYCSSRKFMDIVINFLDHAIFNLVATGGLQRISETAARGLLGKQWTLLKAVNAF